MEPEELYDDGLEFDDDEAFEAKRRAPGAQGRPILDQSNIVHMADTFAVSVDDL